MSCDNYAMKMTWVQEEKDDIYAFKKTFSELGCFALLASIDDLSLTLIRPRNIHLQNLTTYYLANILRDCLLNSGFEVYSKTTFTAMGGVGFVKCQRY